MELDKILIGNRIKFERKSINLTQEELATKLGLNTKSSVSQYENGDTIPSDDIKIKMCNLFNCSLDYLLGKTDIKNAEKININELDIAFASGIKGLNKQNQETLKNIMEGLLAKQKIENKDKDKKEK